MRQKYTLELKKENKLQKLSVLAYDTAHAQAQGVDITRSIGADEQSLAYIETKQDYLSQLFQNLAYNTFNNAECYEWNGSISNKTPCIYIFGERRYIRSIITKYLDIPTDNTTVKMKCKCKTCVNPYHFEYCEGRNAKLTCGDKRLLLAYLSLIHI